MVAVSTILEQIPLLISLKVVPPFRLSRYERLLLFQPALVEMALITVCRLERNPFTGTEQATSPILSRTDTVTILIVRFLSTFPSKRCR